MAEKLITLAREKNLHRVRRAVAALQDKEVVRILFDEIGPAMADRPGGYTRIVKLGTPRLGDKGARVFFELVNFVPERPEAPEETKAKSKAKGKGKAKEEAAAS